MYIVVIITGRYAPSIDVLIPGSEGYIFRRNMSASFFRSCSLIRRLPLLFSVIPLSIIYDKRTPLLLWNVGDTWPGSCSLCGGCDMKRKRENLDDLRFFGSSSNPLVAFIYSEMKTKNTNKNSAYVDNFFFLLPVRDPLFLFLVFHRTLFG